MARTSNSHYGRAPAKMPASAFALRATVDRGKAGTTSTFIPDKAAFVVPPSGGGAPNENGWAKTSPEMRLLLACIRAGVPEASVDTLVAGVDWDRFITLCRNHRCVPLVYRHLQRLEANGATAVPPEVMAALKTQAIKSGVCNVGMTEALCRIQDLFAQNGIRVACIKGPALSLLAYGETATRPFGDLDLIVPETDLARAVDLLLGQGYQLRGLDSRARLRAYLPTRQGVTLQDRAGTIYLDLNAVVISHVLSRPALAAHILDAASPISIDAQRRIYAPGPALMMMVVCMHGAQDMWNKLFTVADVAALLQAHPALDWAGLLATAAEWGQKRAVLAGMETARLLLGVCLPEAVTRAIAADRVSIRLADDAVRGILSMNSLDVSLWRQKQFEYRSRERFGDRLRWIVRVAFVPGEVEFNTVAFPPGLTVLYYLLRPLRLLATACTRYWHQKC